MPATRNRCEKRNTISTGATASNVLKARVESEIDVEAAFVGLNWPTFDKSSATPT
jgi:hypothetical protein